MSYKDLEKHLPKKVKFKKIKKGSRTLQPAISIPSRPSNNAYINSRAIHMIHGLGYEKVHIHIDEENQLVALELTKDKDGYKLLKHGQRGHAMSGAKVGNLLESGRYELDENLSTKEFLVFSRLVKESSLRFGNKDKSST